MTSTLTKSRIERSWKTTFIYLGIGVALAAGGVAIFLFSSGGAWLGSFGIVLVLAALFLFWMAISGAGECACPGCGKPLTGLKTGANEGVLCSECHQYFEGTGGELHATDESKVSSSPTYACLLPEKFTFPEGCCVCGKPETHRVTISTTTQGGGDAAIAVTTGVRTSTRISVEVPHCAEHKDGASLTAGNKNHVKIYFRSYPYLRAFCAMNQTTPS